MAEPNLDGREELAATSSSEHDRATCGGDIKEKVNVCGWVMILRTT